MLGGGWVWLEDGFGNSPTFLACLHPIRKACAGMRIAGLRIVYKQKPKNVIPNSRRATFSEGESESIKKTKRKSDLPEGDI